MKSLLLLILSYVLALVSSYSFSKTSRVKWQIKTINIYSRIDDSVEVKQLRGLFLEMYFDLPLQITRYGENNATSSLQSLPADEALHGLAKLQCCEAKDSCDNPIIFQSFSHKEENYRQLIPIKAIIDNSDIAYFRALYNKESMDHLSHFRSNLYEAFLLLESYDSISGERNNNLNEDKIDLCTLQLKPALSKTKGDISLHTYRGVEVSGYIPLSPTPLNPPEEMDIFLTSSSKKQSSSETFAPGYCRNEALIEANAESQLGLGGAVKSDGSYLSALEVDSIVNNKIPGLKMILSPVIDLVVKPIFSQFATEASQDLGDEVSNKLTASIGAKTPNQVAHYLTEALSKNLTNILTDTVTFYTTEKLTSTMTDDLHSILHDGITENLGIKLTKTLSKNIADVMEAKLYRTVPELLTRSLLHHLPSTLTRAVTHSVVPALSQSLTHTIEEDKHCNTCYFKQLNCRLCHESVQYAYYNSYYSSYYSSYFSDYYSGYYSDALQKYNNLNLKEDSKKDEDK